MWRNWVGNQVVAGPTTTRRASRSSDRRRLLALRASLDPDEVFLNEHLQPLFGLQ